MSKNLVTVWNASPSVIKIGESKSLLKPAHSVEVERTSAINALIDAGKLVVLSNIKDETTATQVDTEPAARKKVKKDAVQEDLKENTEPEVQAESEEQQAVNETEVSEDSILPEESV